MNQKGHSDFSGILCLFAIFIIFCFVAEAGFITLTIVLWKYLGWRIIFGGIALIGAILIIKYGYPFLE